MSFLLQSAHTFEINTTPGAGTPTYSRLGAGLNNFEVSLNEEVAQDVYLDGDGFAASTVTGAQLVITFSGHRLIGDAAQDFIFANQFELGQGRETDFKWTLPDGTIIEGACTIANIEGPSGDANTKSEISFEIHFNGRPQYSPPTP